ncbi:MAG: phasin family protein [Alphaproteobacteria bacterium]|nr:phasin family protein [Alphaproteobacteria bacterium]
MAKKREELKPKAPAVKVKKSGNVAKIKAKPAKKPTKIVAETALTIVSETPAKKPFMEKKMAQKSATPFDKIAKDTADIGREYSEAYVKSGTILMKGVEDIMSTVASLAQASAEKQSQLIKEAMSSKTINEFADVQNKIAQASFDDFMDSATKITELGVKVLTESAEPVSAQMNVAVKKATEAMAA